VNVLKPHQKGAVITLLENEVSQHEISRKTGIDRKTVRKLAHAMAAARSGEGSKSPMATGSDGVPVQIPPPRPPAPGARSPPAGLPAHARSACEGHREWIEAQVRLGRNAMAIYQELVDRFGFTQRYNSVKRFCRALRTREPEQFDRLEFLPEEECQVDYGEGALTRHPHSDRYRRPRLFIMTLRYSRRSYRQVVWKSSSEVWARLHDRERNLIDAFVVQHFATATKSRFAHCFSHFEPLKSVPARMVTAARRGDWGASSALRSLISNALAKANIYLTKT
jgi:hypothetical protein